MTLARTVRSEWIKYWTLPSSLWIIAVTVLVMVGVAALMAAAFTIDAGGDAPPPEGVPDFSPGLLAVTFGYFFGQIVVAVLGVMVATSEYATGQIRATLTAVPGRWPVVVAKVVVTTVVTFALGAAAVGLSMLATYPILAPHDLTVDLDADGAIRSLVGVPLYLTAIALFGLGVGLLVRNTAGGISIVLGVLLVLPFLSMVPVDLIQDLSVYLPSNAGDRLISGATDDLLTPWQGFAVLCAYPVLTLAAGLVALRTRDA